VNACARLLTVTLLLAAPCALADAQTNAAAAASRKWEIIDNSFLAEEAFNQEAGVVQNILTWTRGRHGTWDGSFTQEWPAPGMKHQLSYTLPFSSTGQASGIGDVLLNYRYQLRDESARVPAISPRLSVILPTGRESDGLGSGTAGVQVNLPASKQFGNVYVHANAGYTWIPDVQSTPQMAGSGIWRVAPMLNLMLEGVGVRRVGDGVAGLPPRPERRRAPDRDRPRSSDHPRGRPLDRGAPHVLFVRASVSLSSSTGASITRSSRSSASTTMPSKPNP